MIADMVQAVVKFAVASYQGGMVDEKEAEVLHRLFVEGQNAIFREIDRRTKQIALAEKRENRAAKRKKNGAK